MSAQTISGSKDDITLNLSGLARIYLATWPFLRPELAHFAGLLAGTLALIGFGTAVGFLGFDILWDAVGSASPLSSAQASVLMLPKVSFVDVASLSTADRFTLLNHFLVLTAFIVVTSTTAGSGLACISLSRAAAASASLFYVGSTCIVPVPVPPLAVSSRKPSRR